MNLKTTIFTIGCLAILAVHVEAGWLRRTWRSAKNIWRKAKRIYHKYKWVALTGKALLGDLESLRDMDESDFEDTLDKIENYLSHEHDENKIKEVLDGLRDVRDLSEREFEALNKMPIQETDDNLQFGESVADAIKKSLKDKEEQLF